MAFFSRDTSQSKGSPSSTQEDTAWQDPTSISILAKLRPPSFVQDLFRSKRINSLSPEDVSRRSVEYLADHGGKYGRSETPVSLSAGWQETDQKPIIRRLLKPENRLYTKHEYSEKVRTVSQEYLEKSFFPLLTQKEEEFAEIVALRALYNVRLASETSKLSRANQGSSTSGRGGPTAQTELQIDERTIEQLNKVRVNLKNQSSGRTTSLSLTEAFELVVQKSASARARICESPPEANGVWRVKGFNSSKLTIEAAQMIQIASLVNVFQDHSIRKGPLRYIPSAWLAQVMAGYVQMDLPIPFGLPLFPRKVQSGVKSRMSIHPDAGEASTLARLNAVSHALNLLYPPIRSSDSQDFTERTLKQRRGSFAVGFLDGELFLDCSNVPEITVRNYERDIQDMAQLMGIHRNVVLMPFKDIEKLVPKQFIDKRDDLIRINERKWTNAMLRVVNRYFPANPIGLPAEGDLRTALTRAISRDPARNSSKKPRGVFEDVFLARLFSLRYESIEEHCKTNGLDKAEFEVSFLKGIFDKQKDPELEKLRWQVIRECWMAQIKFLALVDARKVVDPLSLIDPALLKLDYARTLARGYSSPERLEIEDPKRSPLRNMVRRVNQLLDPESIQLLDPESVYPGFNNLDLNQWDAELPDGTPLLQQIWRVMVRCSIHAKQFHIGLNLTTSSERTYQSWQGVPFLRHSYRHREQQEAPGRHKKSDLARDFDVVLDGTFAIEAEGGLGGFPLIATSSSSRQDLPTDDPRRFLERFAHSGQVFLYLQNDPGTSPGQVESYLTQSLNKLDRQRSKGGKGSEAARRPLDTKMELAGSDKLRSLSEAARDLMGSGEAQYFTKRVGWLCESFSECVLRDLNPSNSSERVTYPGFIEDLDGLSSLHHVLIDLSSQNPHFSDLSLLRQSYLLETIKEALQGAKLLEIVDTYRQYAALSASSEQAVIRTDKHGIHLISQLRGIATEVKKLGTLLTEDKLEQAILYLHNRKLVERLGKFSEEIIKLQ